MVGYINPQVEALAHHLYNYYTANITDLQAQGVTQTAFNNLVNAL